VSSRQIGHDVEQHDSVAVLPTPAPPLVEEEAVAYQVARAADPGVVEPPALVVAGGAV